MVIVKISQGLANSMYEFAAGYALSKKLNQELALDISECVVSNACGWGFFLDYFNIPKCKKIVYDLQDVRHIGHEDVNSILKCIREKSQILVENENTSNETTLYKSIKDIDLMELADNIFLCGYFFPREKYYGDYWDDIRRLFTLRDKSEEVCQFEQLIAGKVSIGIHMRRGDMLLAEWATRMSDNYYLAAMEMCREQFGDCIFCVFSDDIEYAKQLMEKDKNVYYIHYLGYDNAALDEFICLSMCTHRILSNSSTFSRLADELNGAEGRKTFLQGDISSENTIGIFRKKLNAVKKYLKKYKKDNNGSVLLDFDQIAKYAKKYKKDNVDNIENYKQKQATALNTNVTCDNCYDINKIIAELSLNVYNRDNSTSNKLLLQKFCCLFYLQKFDMALQLAFRLYDNTSKEEGFIIKYIKMLSDLQYKEEALVEAIGYKNEALINAVVNGDGNLLLLRKALASEKKHFVIVPYAKMVSSEIIPSLGEVGAILNHLGHAVTWVVDPLDPVDTEQITKEARLKNRQGVYLPGDVLLYSKILTDGAADLFSSFTEQEIVVISRRPEMFIDKAYCKNKKVQYVYWDFSAPNEAEALLAKEKMSATEELDMKKHSDYIMTTKDNEGSKFITWDAKNEPDYEIVEDRWDFSKEHRLNTNYIYAVAKMMERVK